MILQGWVCSHVVHWLCVAISSGKLWGKLWSKTQAAKFGTKDYALFVLWRKRVQKEPHRVQFLLNLVLKYKT